MKQYFISRNQKQYLANLHSHTNLSDGTLTPEEMKKAYKDRGYSILAITDHEHPANHSALSDPDFLMLTGYEVHVRVAPRFDLYAPEAHLNLFAKEPDNITMICYDSRYRRFFASDEEFAKIPRAGSERPREYSVSYINELIRTAVNNGYLVSYNHPVWSMEDESHILSYENIFSLEIDNYGSELSGNNEYSGALYDKMLRLGMRRFCHAGDDNHNGVPLDSPESDSFGAFTMILADSLTYPDVIRAMETGNMYASSGPLIHELSKEEDVIHIECSSAKKVILFDGGKTPRFIVAQPGESITSCDLRLRPTARYFRVAVIDENGGIASSRGFFPDEYETIQ
ncbi:MAG: hypothetical protein IJY47_00615 [Clostridia bacterium]|nr:hypothetical protein [Clostridia bacterium]